jgi:uncharacterized membrane protein YbhN (UPF0104 family)
MPVELKMFFIKFALLIAVSLLMGIVFLKVADSVEDAWKTNNRKKKKWILAALFAFIAGLSGWLR